MTTTTTKSPAEAMPPTCPACGAKFQHSQATLRCNQCGLPDEVRDAGHLAIARWKKRHAPELPARTQQHRSNLNRRRNKHGRQGVRR